MSDSADREPVTMGETPKPPAQPVPVVCRMLRTKMSFGSVETGGPDWRTGASTTAAYWCLCTMESAGPDDDFAHARKCREGRRCFVGPDVA
jgi:hypothetical protein